MKYNKYLLFLTLLISFVLCVNITKAETNGISEKTESTYEIKTDIQNDEVHDDHDTNHDSELIKPAGWSVIPFILLLLMIATGPLFYEHFWHKNYPKIAVALAIIVVLYYLFALHNSHQPIHALAEYVQFISLLTGLFFASGAIMIDVGEPVGGQQIGLNSLMIHLLEKIISRDLTAPFIE